MKCRQGRYDSNLSTAYLNLGSFVGMQILRESCGMLYDIIALYMRQKLRHILSEKEP